LNQFISYSCQQRICFFFESSICSASITRLNTDVRNKWIVGNHGAFIIGGNTNGGRKFIITVLIDATVSLCTWWWWWWWADIFRFHLDLIGLITGRSGYSSDSARGCWVARDGDYGRASNRTAHLSVVIGHHNVAGTHAEEHP